MSSQLPILPSAPTAPSLAPAGDPSFVKGKYCFISLGCPKNLVDSERMLGLLQLDGYKLVNTPEEAEGYREARRSPAERRTISDGDAATLLPKNARIGLKLASLFSSST